jgi:hypothetical protein
MIYLCFPSPNMNRLPCYKNLILFLVNKREACFKWSQKYVSLNFFRKYQYKYSRVITFVEKYTFSYKECNLLKACSVFV